MNVVLRVTGTNGLAMDQAIRALGHLIQSVWPHSWRSIMWLALLLPALWSLATAAPEPMDDATEKKRLETLWKQLQEYDEPEGRVRAAFALFDEPNAVAFLAEKLPPLEATKDQMKAWLKELDSGDEHVWQAAYERLRYLIPQLALTPDEQIVAVTTDNGKRLLYGVWSGYLPEFAPGATYRTHLRLSTEAPDGPRLEATFLIRSDGQEHVYRSNTQVIPLAEANPHAWSRAELAAKVLRRIDTAASRAVLERLATGHKDARLTRTAAELLKAKSPPPANPTLDDLWAKLLTTNDFESADDFDTMFELAHAPKAAEFLRAQLPAIKASKEQMKAWLKGIDSDDPKVWKPAFENLLYFRPTIALDWKEQIAAVSTARGRTSLLRVWEHTTRQAPATLDVDPDCTLTLEEFDDVLELTLSFPTSKGVPSQCVNTTWVHNESTHWRRARMAITALEHMKSDEAKAVLKQLADGHPAAPPTQKAKAALSRLKK